MQRLILVLALASSAAAFSAPMPVRTGASLAPSSSLQLRRAFADLPRQKMRQTAKINMQLDIGSTIYEFERMASSSVMNELANLSPASAAVIFAAGILTSLSPCALS
eukprot:1678002-Rhodomonas_salina.1